MARIRYRLEIGRVGVAILAGALAGAGVFTLAWLITTERALGPAALAVPGARGVAVVMMATFFTWLAGLILIGGPAWWLLHRHRLRGWRAAAVAAMAASFAAGLVLAVPLPDRGGAYSESDRGGLLIDDGQLTVHGWLRAGVGALRLSLVGAGVGLLVWRIAYRRD